jgi:hypothetical protein
MAIQPELSRSGTNAMGYQERNAWACVCSIVAVYTPYFWCIFRNPMAYVALFAIAVLCLVALLIGFHIVNSLATASIRKSGDVPDSDELDRAIELRAAKFAGILLATAVLSWSIAAMVGVPAAGVTNIAAANTDRSVTVSDFAIQVPEAMRWIHLLFAGFVISNVAYYGAIVFGYRRLAHG